MMADSLTGSVSKIKVDLTDIKVVLDDMKSSTDNHFSELLKSISELAKLANLVKTYVNKGDTCMGGPVMDPYKTVVGEPQACVRGPATGHVRRVTGGPQTVIEEERKDNKTMLVEALSEVQIVRGSVMDLHKTVVGEPQTGVRGLATGHVRRVTDGPQVAVLVVGEVRDKLMPIEEVSEDTAEIEDDDARDGLQVDDCEVVPLQETPPIADNVCKNCDDDERGISENEYAIIECGIGTDDPGEIKEISCSNHALNAPINQTTELGEAAAHREPKSQVRSTRGWSPGDTIPPYFYYISHGTSTFSLSERLRGHNLSLQFYHPTAPSYHIPWKDIYASAVDRAYVGEPTSGHRVL